MQDAPKSSIERGLVPVVIVAICAGAIIVSLGFDRMPPILKRGIQPADFPQLIAGLIIALTALATWLDPVDVSERIGNQTWATFALMCVFAALIPIDLFLALGVFAVLLAALWGERRLIALLSVGIVVPAAVFLLFDFAFQIRFPRGLLTALWYG
ncbi:MAG: tripartite tricarboxylate transporter TctB family protein [Pseudomonadota bacterium]